MSNVGPFLLPSVQQGWGAAYVQTVIVKAFLYDLSNSIFYPIYPTQNYDVFLGVPYSVAQQFSVANNQLGGSYQNPNIPNPDALFDIAVRDDNPAEVLTENGACLVTPNGYSLAISPPVIQTQYKQCILAETGAPLLTESGEYFTVS